MIWIPLLLWLGLSGAAGLWFLLRASLIRWRPEQAGWRMALYAAGFGLVGFALLGSGDGTVPGVVGRAIGMSAELFVGISALRAVRRR